MKYLKNIITLVVLSATMSTISLTGGECKGKKCNRASTINQEENIPGSKKRVTRKKWIEHSQIQGSDKVTARFPVQPTLVTKTVINQTTNENVNMNITWAKEKDVLYAFATPQKPVIIENAQSFLAEYANKMVTPTTQLKLIKMFTVNDMPAMDVRIYHKDTKRTSRIRVIAGEQTFYELIIARKTRKKNRKSVHHNFFIKNFKIEKVTTENIQAEGQVLILPSTEVEAPEAQEIVEAISETLDVPSIEKVLENSFLEVAQVEASSNEALLQDAETTEAILAHEASVEDVVSQENSEDSLDQPSQSNTESERQEVLEE
jgi:hypothetical protein